METKIPKLIAGEKNVLYKKMPVMYAVGVEKPKRKPQTTPFNPLLTKPILRKALK